MGNELDASHISRDPAVVSAYESDPLVHDRVSARFFTELMQAIEAVNQQAATLKVPILMQVAGEDFLVNAESSRLFFDRLTVEDQTLRVYDGMYHEIYNAPQQERNRVLADMEEWLFKRMTNDE
jgi:alpha-beta hydrolase superfamily lysophospholipase